MILASVALSKPWVAACERAGVPVVLFDRSHADRRYSAVTSANREGGRKVAEFLLAGGHRRLAYIAGREQASTQCHREAGFRDGLAAAGLPLFARAVGDFDDGSTRAAALDLFDRAADERPDAVFVCNDHMALIVLDVLRHELGLAVPGQVSVVGYDDVPQAAAKAYALTTLRQPVNRMVAANVRVLLDQLERPGGGTRADRDRRPLDPPGIGARAGGVSRMKGFDPRFADPTDFILKITQEIWEVRGIDRIRDHYAAACPVRSPGGVAVRAEDVVAATLATLAEFPDRTLLGEDVIWSGDEEHFLSSHRLLSTATHLGDGAFGPATGRALRYRVIADCAGRANQVHDEWLVRDQGCST